MITTHGPAVLVEQATFCPDSFVVVLTGGIASGKSAVSEAFSRRGVPVIDTDVIAHELVQPGRPGLGAIAESFGDEFLDTEGRLDRRKMRETIFADPSARTRLESILHPAIMREAMEQVASVEAPYCIMVVPLLNQSGAMAWTHRILVVDAAESLQIERVMSRDDIDREQAEAILKAQIKRQQRLALADDVIDNSGSLQELEAQVDHLHRKYSRLGVLHQER